MANMSVKEKNAIFKAADEQLAARMLAARLNKPTENLIKQTFRSLDIEAIAPEYFGAIRKEATDIREAHASPSLSIRVKAREKLRAGRELREWKAGDTAGMVIETEKLEKNFKTAKGITI